MNDVFFTFRSVTAAMRGSRLLADQAIRSLTVRTPKQLQEQGCGYSLRLQTRQISEAVKLLRQEQIPMRKLYRQNGDGTLEEIGL